MSKWMSTDSVEERILVINGRRVLLDVDLAELYGVSTKRLNEQVKRNRGRFPSDFMFQLTTRHGSLLMRSRFATGSKRNLRYRPYVFTEHGAVMLASILNSPIAVETSVVVVRAFVRLRQMLATHKKLALKIEELEKKYDGQFRSVFDAIRELMDPVPRSPKLAPIPRIRGFSKE